MDRAQTVILFTAGVLEDYGPHLSLRAGLDEAQALSDRVASVLRADANHTVLWMPEMALGVDSHSTQTALSVRGYVLRDALVDTCRGLMRLGFHRFVCFAGALTPRQLTAIEEAGRLLGQWPSWWSRSRQPRAPRLVSVSSRLVTPRAVWAAPFTSFLSEHAGARDTSVGLALGTVRPLWVNLPPQAPPPRYRYFWLRRKKRLAGYWGHPSAAQSSEGLRILQDAAKLIAKDLQLAWSGDRAARRRFRSWYSVLPPNQSFFRAWLLGLALLAVFVSWAFLYALSLSPGLRP